MTLPYKGILFLGFGGHARSVADVAMTLGYNAFLFYDDNAKAQEEFLGHPVSAQLPDTLTQGWGCFPASGDNTKRMEQIAFIKKRNWPIASIISPTATIGAGANLHEGCFVGHHAHIGPKTSLGAGCIINTAAIVEHDCVVGQGSHVSVNASLAGKVSVGENCFIGAGAIIIDGLSICSGVTIGAGSTVIKDIEKPGTYVGSPARAGRP